MNISDGPPSAFPNGCHIAEVEVDPETGWVDVVRYTFVNDFGTVINPLTVNGQAHGGIVQGIGQALREHVVYDQEGQLLSGSYTDYGLPRAEDAPMFTHAFHPVSAKTNVLGAKGCGEAGCAGALPSVMNALIDALGEYGIGHIDMPAGGHPGQHPLHRQLIEQILRREHRPGVQLDLGALNGPAPGSGHGQLPAAQHYRAACPWPTCSTTADVGARQPEAQARDGRSLACASGCQGLAHW